MGCGSSRASNKHPGLKLPTDCSGAYCNLAISDISGIDPASVISEELKGRILAEIALMDIDTLNSFKAIVDPSTLMSSTAKFGDSYSKVMKFINENGANITDAQVNLLKEATQVSSPPSAIMIQFMIMLMSYYYTPPNSAGSPVSSVPANVATWYSNYVEMLYQAVTKTPAYTPTQLNAAVTAWLVSHPSPGVSVSGFSNQNSALQTVINNVKNNKISGFSDFKPYDVECRHQRCDNGYHTF
jgi:hypothetical protein